MRQDETKLETIELKIKRLIKGICLKEEMKLTKRKDKTKSIHRKGITHLWIIKVTM